MIQDWQLAHDGSDDTLRQMVNRRPQLQIVAPSASPEEAAAVVAALERFMRETAPPRAEQPPELNPWLRAALLEGVGSDANAPPWS